MHVGSCLVVAYCLCLLSCRCYWIAEQLDFMELVKYGNILLIFKCIAILLLLTLMQTKECRFCVFTRSATCFYYSVFD